MRRSAESFDALPRELTRVTPRIEANRSMVPRIAGMSTACGLPAPTVVRFEQRCGFSGFAVWQAVFRDEDAGGSGITPGYRERVRGLNRDTSAGGRPPPRHRSRHQRRHLAHGGAAPPRIGQRLADRVLNGSRVFQ